MDKMGLNEFQDTFIQFDSAVDDRYASSYDRNKHKHIGSVALQEFGFKRSGGGWQSDETIYTDPDLSVEVVYTDVQHRKFANRSDEYYVVRAYSDYGHEGTVTYNGSNDAQVLDLITRAIYPDSIPLIPNITASRKARVEEIEYEQQKEAESRENNKLNQKAMAETFLSPEGRETLLKACTSPEELRTILGEVSAGLEQLGMDDDGSLVWDSILRLLGFSFEDDGYGDSPYDQYTWYTSYVHSSGLMIEVMDEDGTVRIKNPYTGKWTGQYADYDDELIQILFKAFCQ